MKFPFEYSDSIHALRHGPSGYISYESYRPWLRDEYSFRCVYCLHRERWSPTLSFQLDHFTPQAVDPALRGTFENLVLACPRCNSVKSNNPTPDPRQHLTKQCVIVHLDGRIEGRSKEAQFIIRCLRLNSSDRVEFRSLLIEIVQMAHATSPGDLYIQLMSYPDDLPDLAALKPPANSRPEGIAHSAHARRSRGELPDVY